MPVIVRHDVGGGDISGQVGLAALAATMGAQAPQAPIAPVGPQGLPRIAAGRGGIRQGGTSAERARALNAARSGQMREIDARADLQKQSADDALKRTALQAGLGQEMREQEYDMEIQKMQEAAKMQAQQTKQEYTVEQKRKFAEFNNNDTRIDEALAQGFITQDDAEAAHRKNAMLRAGIGDPKESPADPNRLPPPQEQIWTAPSGALMGVDKDGRPKVLSPYHYTREYLEKKAQQDAQEKQFSARAKFEDDLWTKTIKTSEKNMLTGTTKESEEFLTPDRVQARLRERYGPPPEQLQPPPQPRPEDSGNWVEPLKNAGIPVSEENAARGPMLGPAFSVFEQYMDVSYEKIPDHIKPAYDQAVKILMEHLRAQ